MTTLEADPMKMSEDERQCLSESRGGSANVISIFSYCAHRYSEGKIWRICHLYCWRQNLGLQQEFQRQNLGPSPPPDLLIWKYPSGLEHQGDLSSDVHIEQASEQILHFEDKLVYIPVPFLHISKFLFLDPFLI